MCSTDLTCANPAEGVSATKLAEHVHPTASICHHKIAQMMDPDSVEADVTRGILVQTMLYKEAEGGLLFPNFSPSRPTPPRVLLSLWMTWSTPRSPDLDSMDARKLLLILAHAPQD